LDVTVRIPTLLLAGIAGVALALLAVRSAATELVLSSGIAVQLPSLLGGDPRLKLLSAMEALQSPEASPEKLPLAETAAAAARAPLAEEPYILAGVQSLLVEDDVRAERLLKEARRREPRSPVTRMLLLALYSDQGRSDDAANEMIVVARLLPGGTEGVLPELARMAQAEGGLKSVSRVLRTDERLRDPLLQHLVVNGADVELILSLAGARVRPSGELAKFQPWQSQLVNALVEKGDLRRARAVWNKLSGTSGNDLGVIDPDFRRGSSFPPFGWVLSQSADGVAEAGKDEGLQVEYYGRADALLAEQLLTLSEGARYRLSVSVASHSGGADGSLSWKLSCRQSNQPFAELPVRNVPASQTLPAAQFVVPQECPSQWLRLVGSSRQGSKEQGVTFRNVRIERVDPR
jgi:hypothetical protein